MRKGLIGLVCIVAILSGCGQINESTLSAMNDNDNPIAAQISVQTDVRTEEVTIVETTSTEKQTTTESIINTTVATEPSSEKIVITSDIPITTNVGDEPSEITAEEPTQAYIGEVSDIFQKLNSLHYDPVTCDGIPQNVFIDEDGTTFAVNFSEKWVWRDGKEEAYLTDELYFALIDSEPICLQ